MTISDKSIRAILEFEGLDQPWKWPGGGSGITLGYGSDIGADGRALDNWKGILTDAEINQLEQARGITGRDAAHIASRFRNITVTKAQAMKVFRERTLPRWIANTEKTFPRMEELPEDARGALVSLVFNRGTDLTGERRIEMKRIRDAIKNSQAESGESEKDRINNLLRFIAFQIRSMKRLWRGRGLDGLLRRREKEAQLVEGSVTL